MISSFRNQQLALAVPSHPKKPTPLGCPVHGVQNGVHFSSGLLAATIPPRPAVPLAAKSGIRQRINQFTAATRVIKTGYARTADGDWTTKVETYHRGHSIFDTD